MRLPVAMAAAVLLAQCTASPADDPSTPTAKTARSTMARATTNPAGAAQPTASVAPDPTGAVDAGSPPMHSEAAAPIPAVAPSTPRCVQPVPANPPPAVPPGPAPGCPRDPEGNQNAPIVHIVFPDAGGAAVDAELVSSQHDTQRGLMYRTSMPEDHGMLFDMKVRAVYQFWMRNTCIPLDMLFADVDGLIVGIVENAPPLNDFPRGVGCPSRYVLEVNAGWARAHGVKPGHAMTIPAASP